MTNAIQSGAIARAYVPLTQMYRRRLAHLLASKAEKRHALRARAFEILAADRLQLAAPRDRFSSR